MVEILEGILVPHEPQKSEHSKGQLLLYLVRETSHLNLDFQFSATMCEFGVVFVELTKTICRWFIGILWFVQCRIGCGKLCTKCTCLAMDFMKTVSSGFKHCTCLALPVLLLVKLITAFTQQILPLPSCVIDEQWLKAFSHGCLLHESGFNSLFVSLLLFTGTLAGSYLVNEQLNSSKLGEYHVHSIAWMKNLCITILPCGNHSMFY
jgi:hypothetical protein